MPVFFFFCILYISLIKQILKFITCFVLSILHILLYKQVICMLKHFFSLCNIIIYFFKSNALIITSRIVSFIMIIFYVWLILWGGVSKKSDNFTLISCIIFTPRYEAYSSVSNFARPPIDQQAIFIKSILIHEGILYNRYKYSRDKRWIKICSLICHK